MRWTVVPTPIGELGVAVDGDAVCRVDFGGHSGEVDADPLLSSVAAELGAYFAGGLTEFDVPVRVDGGSEFERAVWRAIARIPYGATATYGQVAAAVGEPGGARAVGVACNRNPVPIIVPCHRVVGAGNKLVGFGGGLHRKRFLLELEARVELARAFST